MVLIGWEYIFYTSKGVVFGLVFFLILKCLVKYEEKIVML